jgi:hypothetical protein
LNEVTEKKSPKTCFDSLRYLHPLNSVIDGTPNFSGSSIGTSIESSFENNISNTENARNSTGHISNGRINLDKRCDPNVSVLDNQASEISMSEMTVASNLSDKKERTSLDINQNVHLNQENLKFTDETKKQDLLSRYAVESNTSKEVSTIISANHVKITAPVLIKKPKQVPDPQLKEPQYTLQNEMKMSTNLPVKMDLFSDSNVKILAVEPPRLKTKTAAPILLKKK